MLAETGLAADVFGSELAKIVGDPTESMGRPIPETHVPTSKALGGLVLTRHLDESIMIGDEVEIQVVGIQGGTARLRVVAPRAIPVHRREIFDAILEGFAPAPPAAVARPSGNRRPGQSPGGLVLARAAGQSLMIGGEVEVIVAEVRPTTVKMKIVAPRSVAVHRREVFEVIRDRRD